MRSHLGAAFSLIAKHLLLPFPHTLLRKIVEYLLVPSPNCSWFQPQIRASPLEPPSSPSLVPWFQRSPLESHPNAPALIFLSLPNTVYIFPPSCSISFQIVRTPRSNRRPRRIHFPDSIPRLGRLRWNLPPPCPWFPGFNPKLRRLRWKPPPPIPGSTSLIPTVSVGIPS